MLESGIRFLPEGFLADAVIVVVFLFVSNARLRLGLEEMGNDRADRRRPGRAREKSQDSRAVDVAARLAELHLLRVLCEA